MKEAASKRGRPRVRFGLVAIVVLLGALTFGLTSAWAPPNTKWYSTAITAPNPANVPAGAATPVTINVTNCGTVSPCAQNSTQSLGSANLTFPTNLSVPLGPISASNITQAQGKPWSADVVANPNGTRTVRLRNPGPNTTNALAPGQSVSVKIDVTASGTCGPQPPIATQTKQSNDFSGNGNDFTRMGAEPQLTVSPGSFASFAWTVQPDASQTAGTAFTPATGIKVEARDACGALITSYQGGATFSGLHNSPSGTQPNYGFTWLNGVATSTTVTDYKAETTKLTVTDGTISADSSSFTVAPGSLNSLAFTTQPEPDAWEPRAPGSFPVAVTAVDQWGNGVAGQTVTLTIDPAHNPGGSTLTCDPSCSVGTNASGVASFSVSLDKDGLGYQLQATKDTSQANSNPFKIGDVKTCSGNNCLLNGSADGSSTSASVSNASGDLLALGFGGSIQTASGKCGGAAQIGPGFEFVQATKSGPASAPIWTITATLSKNTPGFDPSRGATQWEICLGTVNLGLAPYNGTDEVHCANNGDFAWPAKTGCAVWDPGTEMFWGDIPNAAPNVKKCDLQTTPVVLKKNKTGSGDIQATFCAPYPWDGGGGWR